MSFFKNQNTQRESATTPLKKTAFCAKMEITEGTLEHTLESLNWEPSVSNPGVAGDRGLGRPTCDANASKSNETVKPRRAKL